MTTPPPAFPSGPRGLGGFDQCEKATRSRRGPTPTSRARSRRLARALDGFTILVVEDDPDARRITRLMLERHGASVVSAQDGVEALSLLPTIRPHAAVVDLRMPRLDGYALVRRLRADPRYRRLPVIALTVLGNEADYLRTLEYGFSAHLTKPADDSVLAATLLRLTRPRGR